MLSHASHALGDFFILDLLPPRRHPSCRGMASKLLSEITELRVSVVPRSVARSKALDRNRDGFDYRIDVSAQRKIEPSVGNLDALRERVEEIACRRLEARDGRPEQKVTERTQ